ncbi:hypothetical protein C0993_003004, partial [Termitomyces sp. T159_Od127]
MENTLVNPVSEGSNGRLPNQDLLNSVQRVSQKEGVPVIIYDHLVQPQSDNPPSFVPDFIQKHFEVPAYLPQAKNVIRQFGYQARGRPSGIHGLFHHAAMMLGGLEAMTDAAWMIINRKSGGTHVWLRRRRPIAVVLSIIGVTHVLGAVLLSVVTSSRFINHREIASPAVFTFFALIPLLALLVPQHPTQNTGSLSPVLKGINLCLASSVISIISVLNFPLAAILVIMLGIPLSVSSSGPVIVRLVKYVGYALLGLGWLLFKKEELFQVIWDWE